jgi:acetyltransferase-like isoleucine patch superfamily enzyme
VVIDDNCLLDAKGESNRGIRIGDGVFIGRNTILSCKNGDIDIADRARTSGSTASCSRPAASPGAGVLMAAYVYVIGGDHDFSDPPRRCSSRPALGRREHRRRRLDWRRAKILDGVVIGTHAVIGAGAVVREAVPEGAVAVGVPARVDGEER